MPGRMTSSVRVRRIDGAHVAYREITVIEIKEVLRLWLLGRMGLRPIAETVGLDRKTVRRYIDAGVAAGLARDGGEAQLTDALLGAVTEAVRPERPAGHGAAWEACRADHDRIKTWLDKDLKLTKVEDLLARRGSSCRTAPFTATRRRARVRRPRHHGAGGRRRAGPRATDRLRPARDDVRPGHGTAAGAVGADLHRRGVAAHVRVVLVAQQLEDVIAGCEAAWDFYGGVFRVIIRDNMKAIVDRADPLQPRLNVTFTEYAGS